MFNPLDFSGRRILVSGASRGIGWAIAKLFVEQGGKVVLVSNEDASLVPGLDELFATGLAEYVKCDLADEAQLRTLLNRCWHDFGPIDILINNVGTYGTKQASGAYSEPPFQASSLEVLDRYFKLNIRPAWHLSMELARLATLHQKQAVIGSIGSINGDRSESRHAGYDGTKGFIHAFSRALAIDLAPEIRTFVVAPGFIATPLTDSVVRDSVESRAMIAQIPLGRLGRPEDVAQVVLLLSSSWASYITGAKLLVDGGLDASQHGADALAAVLKSPS